MEQFHLGHVILGVEKSVSEISHINGKYPTYPSSASTLYYVSRCMMKKTRKDTDAGPSATLVGYIDSHKVSSIKTDRNFIQEYHILELVVVEGWSLIGDTKIRYIDRHKQYSHMLPQNICFENK